MQARTACPRQNRRRRGASSAPAIPRSAQQARAASLAGCPSYATSDPSGLQHRRPEGDAGSAGSARGYRDPRIAGAQHTRRPMTMAPDAASSAASRPHRRDQLGPLPSPPANRVCRSVEQRPGRLSSLDPPDRKRDHAAKTASDSARAVNQDNLGTELPADMDRLVQRDQ